MAAAIRKTFSNRRTEIHARPVALTSDFTGEFSKQEQWRGFIRKNRLENVPEELSKLIDALAGFLEPVANALITEQPFEGTWNAPAGPWSDRL